jgi:hypothetical protein
LGNYIIGKHWRENLSVRECVMFALQALNAAKKHAEGVGGYSQFITIESGFVSPVIPYDPKTAEESLDHFENASGSLLLDIGNDALDDDGFREKLLNFAHSITALRDRWRANAEPYQRLLDSLTRTISSRQKIS